MAVASNKNIGWLEIPMYNLMRMQITQCIQQLIYYPSSFCFREIRTQWFTIYPFHHDTLTYSLYSVYEIGAGYIRMV